MDFNALTKSGENYLVISDLQIPFEHKQALDFVKYLKKHYKIKDENMLCAGDELDQLFGGLWKKDPNSNLSAMTEIMISIERLKEWYSLFPFMKVAISNHGTRWQRKALDAEIPSILLRKYEEVIEAPKDWKWAKRWLIKASKKEFILEHGDDWGGPNPAAKAALHYNMSVCFGHFHSKSQIIHHNTGMNTYWSFVTGSLIDFDSFAFNYARAHSNKPLIGCGVILDGGRIPMWVPLE
jgi:hypothetical protein